MGAFPIAEEVVLKLRKQLGISTLAQASIRQIVQLADGLQDYCGEGFIRTEMGVPGLPAAPVGVTAQVAALHEGVASVYPPIQGVPELKEELSRFARLFMNLELPARGCIPTVGAMHASLLAFMVANRRDPDKDTTLFIDPGFPVQKRQLGVLGMKYAHFDIYDYRGDKLRARLEEFLQQGHIGTFLYSNPNNPAWICLTDKELEIIGELATKYDVVVLEDLAYFGMDFREDFGRPGVPPFVSSVARYTDNYVLLFSASKIFSYAGERLGAVLISDALFDREFTGLSSHFLSTRFGPALLQEALYATTAGVSHSAQRGGAAVLKGINDGVYDFTGALQPYGERARLMKQLFLKYGFHLVYDQDEGRSLADGFYFTVAHKGMTGEQLLAELLRFGISAITLDTTGSSRTEGLRICVSHTRSERMAVLEERLRLFAAARA